MKTQTSLKFNMLHRKKQPPVQVVTCSSYNGRTDNFVRDILTDLHFTPTCFDVHDIIYREYTKVFMSIDRLVIPPR
jgi:hypothetical protein